ncbi:RICIN domain-containing protein, partial [Streptomyces sp. NPDC127119]|uniref:RICIN domain-containing protein n=1 Tax=Streptomyces sp. NPDC127119 TaxID=3345370 RepID=UPI0036312C4B
SGVDPMDVEGTYVQKGFLPRWLATFLGIFMALAITFVMLWIAYKPSVRSSATEKLQEAGISTLAPSPSLTPEAPKAPSVEPVASEPAAPTASGDSGGGGGGGGGNPSPKPKPKSVVPATEILLRNPTTKMCADLPGREKGKATGRVQQAPCTENPAEDNQLWNLEVRQPKGGPGGSALFVIRNVKDQLCMDLPNAGAQPVQVGIYESPCDGTTADNDLWWIDKQESGAYWIRNFASNNKCLDVAGFSTGTVDTNLTLYHCSNTDDQEWLVIHPNRG